ncbi:MAG: undecaprenyldiphospho-muramoylpentapeptide beta-N-acetylglucosaminyltransferase [Candidatus Aminicenantia bacterium]
MKKKKVIIAGGGTGGHLYPALVVAKEMRKREPGLEVIFVGTGRETEKKIINHYGNKLIVLRIEGLKRRKVSQIIKTLFLIPRAMVDSFKIIKKLKPNLVMGAGGYSSGPVVLTAALMKIPTLILEQNLRPGLTNRLLKPWVKKVFLSFESSKHYFKKKGIYTGNPVRDEFYTIKKKERNKKLSLLIFGGSQGAHIINQTVVQALSLLDQEKQNLRIFHQTGEKDFNWVKESYHQLGIEAMVSSFFFDIYKYFEKSDILICRAGASTLAELIASRKAAILIPFARAANNHQELNALESKKYGAAEVILEKELTGELLAKRILYLLKNPDRINEMEENIARLRVENPAGRIAMMSLRIMEDR